MKELDYQLDAIQKLKDKSNELLNLQGNHTIVFKAPTGSGKTVIMAEFLKDFVTSRSDNKAFSFIWTAPRKLHAQSRIKLENHYRASMALRCSGFEDLLDRMIDENEILFLNWESINREDNIFYRENEQEFYLEKVIENTKDDGRIVVLIIDESHHTAGAENTQGLINIINAKLTIEVSATPPNINNDGLVVVHRQKVIEEEMIKKRIAINPDFKNIILRQLASGDVIVQSDGEESTNEFVIRAALKKRNELANLLEQQGSSVNPLLLIQLPDRRSGQLDVKDEIVDILKDKHDIIVANDRLAIYLADDKENLATITKNDSPVEVMIFKQAIALGWDCPRASILVLFRDWRSIVFSIQTVGRIMRMPELRHYANNELNVGYVYTNLSDISIHQDIADGYATVFHSGRNDEVYENIKLLSCHSVRQRERTRLTPNFIRFFLEAASELDLKNKISVDNDDISLPIITDGIVTDPDKEFKHLQEKQADVFDTHSGETVKRKQNEEEIQHLYEKFLVEALSPLYPEERSIGRIKRAISEFFRKEFTLKFQYAGIHEQMIVLAPQNKQLFMDTVNLAKEKYMADIERQEKQLNIDENWEIPKSINYTDEYTSCDLELSLMLPFYERTNASTPEKNFAHFLNDKKDEIEWWFKNGERDGTFFAVPRKEGDDKVPFYVDWLVKYKNGKIGLFDTKGGITAETALSRAEGLYKYIKKQNQSGKNLFGGIVIWKNGSFWLHPGENYRYDDNDLPGTGWAIFP